MSENLIVCLQLRVYILAGSHFLYISILFKFVADTHPMEHYSSYTILTEQKLILCCFQGEIQMKDFTELHLKFLSDQAYDSSFNLIMDLRNSVVSRYSVDMLEYIKFFRKNIHLTKSIKSGILISTSDLEILFNIFRLFSRLNHIDVNRFHKIDDCLNWMQFSENEKAIIENALESISKHEIQ